MVRTVATHKPSTNRICHLHLHKGERGEGSNDRLQGQQPALGSQFSMMLLKEKTEEKMPSAIIAAASPKFNMVCVSVRTVSIRFPTARVAFVAR